MRQVEARPGATSPVPARSTIAVAKAFHACAGLVFKNPSRRRKMAVAQLSGQSALRRAESISFLYGEYAPAADPERLRVLPEAAGCLPEKIRPASRQPQSPRGKANSAAAFRDRGSAQRNGGFYRQARFGQYSSDLIQDPCR